MIRRPPRSTLFPTRRSSDLLGVIPVEHAERALVGQTGLVAGRAVEGLGVCVEAHAAGPDHARSEEHTSELQSLRHLVCRLLLEKKKKETEQIEAHGVQATEK